MSTDAAERIATLDARLLYWVRLPQAARLSAAQQDYRFERVLPRPVEGLHIARAALPDGSVLLAAIEPDRLRAQLAQRSDVGPATWALVPDRIPTHLGAEDGVRLRLDLLHGAFEPAARRGVRRLRDAVTAGALGLACALAVVGIERRSAAYDHAGAALRQVTTERLTAALGSGGPLPPAARLTQELRRLEQAAGGATAPTADPPSVLQQLWAAWPRDVVAEIETVSLTSDRLVVRGAVPTLADAERLARASPLITVGTAVFRAQPLQAEQRPQGAAFLITWLLQARGGRP
jgi:hypothetical protein